MQDFSRERGRVDMTSYISKDYFDFSCPIFTTITRLRAFGAVDG
jgi:hypothetical protein